MNPLLPLGSLASNIEHAVLQRTQIKMGLGNTGGAQPGSQNVLVTREEIAREESVEIYEEA
jgi:hypothetical protein